MADAIPLTSEPTVSADVPKKPRARTVPAPAVPVDVPQAGYVLADGVTVRQDN
jgi:hypothetical protein